MDFQQALNTVIAELTPQPWDYINDQGITLTVIPEALRADPGDAEVLLQITVSHRVAARIGVPSRDLPQLITALNDRTDYDHATLYRDTIALAHGEHTFTLTVSDTLWCGTDETPAICTIELPDAQRLPLASALARALDVAKGWEG